MLKTEVAMKRLAQWKVIDDDYDDDRPLDHLATKLKKLPKKLRDICYALASCGAEGENDYSDETLDFVAKKRELFPKLTKADRAKVLKTLFGNTLASEMETAIQWIPKQPAYARESKEVLANRQINVVERLIFLADYQHDVLSANWVAAWTPYLPVWSGGPTPLLAAMIDKGGKAGKEVLETLLQSARKEHEIGSMGDHVIGSLLCSSSPEGWELMENMLVAAQRQEGLRQSILSGMDEAHPEAFRRMLNVIVENNLVRFSSVVQCFNQWFGMGWGAGNKKVRDALESLLLYLNDPKQAAAAAKGEDPEFAYFALWAMHRSNPDTALKAAQRLYAQEDVELRFVAAAHAGQSSASKAFALRMAMLDDEDDRIVAVALFGLQGHGLGMWYDEQAGAKLFNKMESLLDRFPKKSKKYQPLVWPWCELEIDQPSILSGMTGIDGVSRMRLVPYMALLPRYERWSVVQALTENKGWHRKPEIRKAVFELTSATGDVREVAFDAFAEIKLNQEEVLHLEGLLTRTATVVRTSGISLLLGQKDKDAIASAERLAAAGNKHQRLAGLELLRQLAEDDRLRSECVAAANAFSARKKKPTKDERVQIDAILASHEEPITLDDCLGLCDLSERTPPTPPKKHAVKAVTPATLKLIKSLDAFLHKNRKEEVTYKGYRDELTTELLGEVYYCGPSWFKSFKEQKEEMPFREELMAWYESLPASCKDKDGLHLVRAYVYCEIVYDYWLDEFKSWGKRAGNKPITTFLCGTAKAAKLKSEVVDDMIGWLLIAHMPKNAQEFCVDVTETIYAMIPSSEHERLIALNDNDDDDDDDDENEDWRRVDGLSEWQDASGLLGRSKTTPKKLQKRIFALSRWRDEPTPGAKRDRVSFYELIAAYLQKEVNLADIYDALLGPRDLSSYGRNFDELHTVTQRGPDKELRKFIDRKEVRTAIDGIIERLLEIELARGETPTPASAACLSVAAYRGIDTLFRLLSAMDGKPFKKPRGYRANVADSRVTMFTRMVELTYPDDEDTPQAFAKAAKQAIKEGVIPEERLLQLAFLAPQWTSHIEEALKWPGFTEGLYWFMGHMKYVWGLDEALASDEELETKANVDWSEIDEEDAPERLSAWERVIRERTPLTDEERSEGAIDVAWFRRTYELLTPARWQALADSAKYATTGAQAKRAQMVADTLIGKTAKKTIVDGIKKRNLKENVRLLGLLPLAGGKAREKDLQDRYEVLQAYRKYASGLSSLSRPDAMRAYEIGMQNLAATAGYADPMRLQWAMEAESTKDIAAGPIAVKKGDVSLTLTLDEEAAPHLTILRGEKQLKSLPKTVNKDKKFVELRERHKQLKRQASRVKQSLEQAMCRGDGFTGGELVQLAGHAILWPQLQRCVLIGDGIMGYPDKKGKALRDHAGKLEPVKKAEALRIAHPFDLLKSKAWSKWQQECFSAERIQPFKQVFRELYVVTSQEKKDKDHSNRYATQQVNPRQAYALWGRRGWSVDEYENVWKSYHDEQINVSVSFDFGHTTPLEVEGLTLDSVSFRRRDNWEPMLLKDVPPRLFSEVMRDLDLVVSVAHVGDVDPEATASTVEMREALLRETCQLLGIKNVKFKANRAVIKGKLGDYSIHLGSGVVHKLPGGAVCLVAVPSEHRGRLFLPFADDDPRTAEVVSKTLLLARDDEIDDPILLDQIR